MSSALSVDCLSDFDVPRIGALCMIVNLVLGVLGVDSAGYRPYAIGTLSCSAGRMADNGDEVVPFQSGG